MDINTVSSAAYSRAPLSVVAAGATGTADDSKNAAPVAPYLSPVYKFDPLARLSVLVFRDEVTGDVTQQFPSKKVVEQYRRTRGEPPGSKSTKPSDGEASGSSQETASEKAKPVSGGGSETGSPSKSNAAAPSLTVSSNSAISATPSASTPTPSPSTAETGASVQRVSLKV